jgi:hypothetical protein
MDFEKCEECNIPVSYCDGMTRYKCGKKKGDVGKFCKYNDA